MTFIRSSLTQLDHCELFPLGDVHYGNKTSNYKEFQKYLDLVNELDTARVIIMGDIIEVGQRDSPGMSLFSQDVMPQDQIEWVVETLEPIKDKIICVHDGNHERRFFKNSGNNVLKNLCRELRITYAPQSAFTRINFKNVGYSLWSTHGTSNARLTHTKINALYNATRHIHDIDIYMMGHVHSRNFAESIIRKPDLRNHTVKDDKSFYVLTGHFLEYDGSYAEEYNLQPEPIGAPIIVLDGLKKNIRIKKFEDFK